MSSQTDLRYRNYDNYLLSYPTLNTGSVKAFEYTRKAIERMDQVLSDLEFEERDTDCIFSYLMNEVRVIPFGDYLRRYIYIKAELSDPFEEIPLREYQDLIRDSFRENLTPFSWNPTSRKPGSIIKRWLTQKRVLRQTVFLLGFGLRMNEKDVSEFLMKGIRETDFNFYDPGEVLLWHCYHCGKRYPEYLELLNRADSYKGTLPERTRYWETVGSNPEAFLFDEEKLLGYYHYLKKRKEKDSSIQMAEYQRLYENVGKLCDEEGGELPSRIENKYLSGIPRDDQDNLKKMGDSSLAEIFMYQKMSRQRIDAVIKGKQMPDRFDIITLVFFEFSQKDMEPDRRRDAFIFEVNSILIRCRMSCLLFTIPYEAFVIMCLMTDDPLNTYSEIWEMSYGRMPEDTAE